MGAGSTLWTTGVPYGPREYPTDHGGYPMCTMVGYPMCTMVGYPMYTSYVHSGIHHPVYTLYTPLGTPHPLPATGVMTAA